MDPSLKQDIPERSPLWSSGIQPVQLSGKVLDKTTLILSLCLALFSFVIFRPVISQISFEEAFFTPLVPFLISVFGSFNINPGDFLRGLFIGSFMISTVGVYLLTRDLTRRQLSSILAAILYLIPPVPIFVLTFFRQGVLETELGSAKSFFTIVYGDGANFLALAIIPFASLFLLKYLKLGKSGDLVWSTILCSLILLANATQSLSLGFIGVIVFVTQLFFGNVRAKVQRFVIAAIMPIGLVSFWYTPHFWYLGANFVASAFLANMKLLFPLPFIIFLITLFFSFVFFARREDRMAIFFCFLVFIVFAVSISVWLISGKSFVPHPHRMVPNLNMFGAVVIALLLSMLFDRVHFISAIGQEFVWGPFKIFVSLIFAVLSFLGLSLLAYSLSPFAILAVSGRSGIWTKIRLSVLAERRESLELAGGNFQLISSRGDSWQIWLGTAVTVLFFLVLVWLVIHDEIGDQEAA
ncbi:hypothetical protein A2870_01675 [Candidatus Curtissbacteria bacterium RIFCSPHIGHO2_01_FULL_41_11]|uniref:Glycosyltransferase RgtA/B/C/D-like domain-containing protein n=1 Tax=Candidatus Curtissbacteria bacterium RIFCSPHIGHO2_01_FULL_41_11 TaxID=1797711 RepID=A0A1F5G375_9BACT|nr:MAG: hypothetical protein A2870_01675 [Candidatus Curtissbacteria bacterium RIFCSPHIGHO2_01_FULL_41_11]